MVYARSNVPSMLFHLEIGNGNRQVAIGRGNDIEGSIGMVVPNRRWIVSQELLTMNVKVAHAPKPAMSWVSSDRAVGRRD